MNVVGIFKSCIDFAISAVQSFKICFDKNCWEWKTGWISSSLYNFDSLVSSSSINDTGIFISYLYSNVGCSNLSKLWNLKNSHSEISNFIGGNI